MTSARILRAIAGACPFWLLAACGGGLYEDPAPAAGAPSSAIVAAGPSVPASGSPGAAGEGAKATAAAASDPRTMDPYARTLVNPRARPKDAAEYLNGVNLFFDSKEEMLAAVASYAAANPRVEVIRGYGWRAEAFGGELPTALELDAVVRDRPVILLSADLGRAWRNSRAAGLPIVAPSGA